MTDLDALRAAFPEVAMPTVGVEEEFFVVDPGTGEPRWDAPDLCERLADARFKQELPASQLEHVSAPHDSLAEVAASMRRARADLAAAAPGHGFVGAGLHPAAPRIERVPDHPRYHETLAVHPWASGQQMVGALQVHVAVGTAEVSLAVHDAFRSHLPDLLALSASAPFHDGRDTGLATARPLVSTLLPRQGVPPAWGSWERYASARRWMAAADVADERRLWWEVRLRPLYGTLEVRVMDSQPTAAGAIALVTLSSALLVHLADRARAGEPLPTHPTERIAENRWRALHRGREATLADLDSGELEPLHVRIGRLLDAVTPAADRLGGSDLLDGVVGLLRHGTGADAMRAAADERGISGVAPWLAEVFSTGC
jgi:glutamate---cysteine ligase / carboxylate-amine ligase